MNRIFRIAALSAACTIGWPTAHPLAAQQQSDVAEGARVYGDMCGRCHAPRSPLERTDRDWVVIVNHMRARGNLTGAQVKRVLAFLQATNNSPSERIPLAEAGAPRAAPIADDRPPSEAAADVSHGRELVTAKACVGCHVVAGTGGQIGPSLDGVVKRRGPGFVRHKLGDPTFNNTTSMMPNFGLSGGDIEAILAYLATLGSR